MDGHWIDAQAGFEEILAEREDKLTRLHLEYMAKTKYMVPNDWEGFKYFKD